MLVQSLGLTKTRISMDWNDKKNISISFQMPVDEKMKEFINRIEEEDKEINDAFKERVKKLFDEYITLEGIAISGYDKFLGLFSLGYQLGWNDHYDLIKDK